MEKIVLFVRRLDIKIHRNILIIISMLYVYVPVFIFAATWLRPIFAIMSCLMMTLALVLYFRHLIVSMKTESDKIFSINVIFLVIIAIFIFLVGIICGWSGYGYQFDDWAKHNAILHDLLERSWPVIYRNNGQTSFLTYYIGQYLTPAFIGKLFHLSFRMVLLFNWLWSSLGLVLVYIMFTYVSSAKSVKQKFFCFIMLVFCGGLMSLQQEIGNSIYPEYIGIGLGGWQDYFLCYGKYMLQYRTNFISLFGAFGQTIIPWLVVSIFYTCRKDVKNYLPLLLPVMLCGTFSFVAIAALAVAAYIVYVIKTANWKIILKDTFSIQNCLMAISLGAVLFLYFLGYLMQKKPDGMALIVVTYYGSDIGIYLIYVLGSFLLYALLIAKENIRNCLFLTTVALMLIFPFFKMGSANDLLMGTGIVTSFVLYICVAQFLFQRSADPAKTESYTIRKGALIVLILIGFIKPSVELYNNIDKYNYRAYSPYDAYLTLEKFADRNNESIPIDLRYNYYTYDAADSPFMKYIGDTKVLKTD